MAKHDSYNKWEWALLGGLVGAAVVVVAEVAMVAGAVSAVEKKMVIKRASADGYTLMIGYLPTNRFRGQQVIAIQMTDNGQNAVNEPVNISITQGSTTQKKVYHTDESGAIVLELVAAQAQTMTVSATFIAPNGETLFDQITLVFPSIKSTT